MLKHAMKILLQPTLLLVVQTLPNTKWNVDQDTQHLLKTLFAIVALGLT
jgi:hypothetical protein